jgi:phage terminase large subunit
MEGRVMKLLDLNIEGGSVLKRTLDANTRIIAHQGGTSSGKTWSILQALLIRALTRQVQISVCAITLPHLKRGAMRDFKHILVHYGLYNDKYFNKTDITFRLGSSSIEFFSLDDPGKAHGPRRDILFVNEANLIPQSTFQQLVLRTRKTVILDYNPVDTWHWLYETILTRPDCTLIKSTYKDNRFLSPDTIREIENLQKTDANLWRIYGMGEPGQLLNTIYNNWQTVPGFPDTADVFYGLDFGFNNPTALVKCHIRDKTELYADELIYQTHLTNTELIDRLKSLKIGREPIYADAAEPQRIEEIRRAGFNIKPADKSVRDGIDRIKRLKVLITGQSINLLKEYRSYKWQEDTEQRLTDIPVKFNDHLMDALRYAVHSHALKPSGKYCIR